MYSKKKIRYDGKDMRNLKLCNNLEKYFNLIPICPEVECGFSTPREPVILMKTNNKISFTTKYSKKDYTKKIINWSLKKISLLKSDNIVGFVFKSKSPSCGIKSVKMYSPNDQLLSETSTGIFSNLFITHFPSALISEDKDLQDKNTLNCFIITAAIK